MNKPWRMLWGGSVAAVSLLASVARAGDKPALHVVMVDSEETVGQDGRGVNAVDGNPDTIWITQWRAASPAHPHEIILRLDAPRTIRGLTYLPRQDDSDKGTIRGYEIYLSTDGRNFGQPVKQGEFALSKGKQIVLFEPQSCSFIKLVALSEVNNRPYTSAAEIGVLEEDHGELPGEEAPPREAPHALPLEQGARPAQPREIVLELSSAMPIGGLIIRPGEVRSGSVKDYEIYLSDNGRDFAPVKKGVLAKPRNKQIVKFITTVSRYVKFRFTSEASDNPWAAGTEIDVIPSKR